MVYSYLKVKATPKPALDRSLRIIATDLGGIKNWEHLRGMLSFLFEIYGMHNAANFFQYSILMQLFVDWVHVLLTWVLKSEKFINKLCICTCIYSFYGALLIFFLTCMEYSMCFLELIFSSSELGHCEGTRHWCQEV